MAFNSPYKKINNLKFTFFYSVAPLLTALSIYLLFRPTNTIVFNLFKNFAPLNFSASMHEVGLHLLYIAPEWLIYSLPGGLWLFSFQNLIHLFLGFKQFKFKTYLILSSFVFSIGLEFLQLLNITDGKFDWMDILFYLIASATSLLISKRTLDSKKGTGSIYAAIITTIFFCCIVYLADVSYH